MPGQDTLRVAGGFAGFQGDTSANSLVNRRFDLRSSEQFRRAFNNPQQGADKITLFVLVWIVWGRGRQPLCQCLHQRLAVRVAQ